MRWLQGNLQVYFCGDELPIWDKLNWIQKSFHVNQIFYCFNPIFSAFFLIAPLVSLYVGLLPIIGSISEYIYYGLPFTILNIVSYSWACDYRLSFFWDEIYNTTFCFPALQRLWLVLRNPFAKASTATRKGVKAEKKNYNLHINWQLLVLFALFILGILINLGGNWFGISAGQEHQFEGKQVMLFWLIYNTIIIFASILTGIDQPVRRQEDRFPLRTACKISAGDNVYYGYSNNISESGANIILKEKKISSDNEQIIVELLDYNFSVNAKIIRANLQKKHCDISLAFQDLSLEQNRYLVNMLYCNLTWWKQRKKTGFTDSFLALITAILTLRPIRNNYH